MRSLGDPRDALTLLTVAPARRTHAAPRPDGDLASWFPFVGLLLGAVAAGFVVAVVAASAALSDGWVLGRSGFVLGAVVIAAWAGATRFLHWDGLADTADAMWGGRTRERRLEIMRDPHIGAFGVTAVAIVLTLQVTALGSLLTYTSSWMWLSALVAAPVVGRLAATFACWLGTPARPDGLGSAVVGRPSPAGAVLVAVLVVALTLLLWGSGTLRWILWWPLSIVLALVVPHLFARGVGGVTGDNLGASILWVETAVLVAAALAGGL